MLSGVSERLTRQVKAGKPTVQADKLRAILAVLGFDLAAVSHVPDALKPSPAAETIGYRLKSTS